MKGILVEKNGEADVLNFQELPLQKPGPGQVRVEIKAAGLNFIDIYQRRGTYAVPLPYTPGQEGAGIVAELGEGVTLVKVGDRIAYTGQLGSYSESAIVQADKLIALPPELSFEQGAAFPLQGMTAHYLINEYRKPGRGDVVLIHAAAGGMGLLLVQWAKHYGAMVIGTVSTQEKAEAAKDAGADYVIFYNREDFVEATKRLTDQHGADLVIDGVGKTTFAGSLEAVALRGTVVIFGSASGAADPILPNSLQKRAITVSGGSLMNYLLTRDELMMRANDVLNGIKSGWLKLRIDNIVPLADARGAHKILEARKSIGKIVLKAE